MKRVSCNATHHASHSTYVRQFETETHPTSEVEAAPFPHIQWNLSIKDTLN